MDFNYFLEKKYKTPKKNKDYFSNNYGHNRRYSGSAKFNPIALLQKLRTNRKLKIVFIILLFCIIAIVIGLLALIYSLSTSVIDGLAQEGFAGIMDDIMLFLNDLWNGKE